MLRVALTGGIATGKTQVLRHVLARGVAAIDADDLVHAALLSGTAASRAISSQFGPEIMEPDGAVNRKALGVRVFSDAVARHTLETILHPTVYDAIRQWFEDSASAGMAMGVAAIPLLYETGHERDFDAVVVTACEPAAQLQRMISRDSLSGEEARHRLAAQLPIGEKVRRADFVIRTDGTVEDTDRQVDDVLEKLRARSRESKVKSR